MKRPLYTPRARLHVAAAGVAEAADMMPPELLRHAGPQLEPLCSTSAVEVCTPLRVVALVTRDGCRP